MTRSWRRSRRGLADFERARRHEAILGLLVCLALLGSPASGRARSELDRSRAESITLVVRDTEVREVFEMLSRKENVGIALGDDIEGKVSISLFDVGLDEAIRSIAQAAGYGVERRDGTYVILDFDEVGQDRPDGVTDIRSFKIQYTDAEDVETILEKHLSRYGQITALPERRLIVVEDLPEFLDRVEGLLEEVDRQPSQILLEAKVLEINLSENDVLGVDWSRIAQVDGARLEVGVDGLANAGAPGLFFNLLTNNLEGALEALTEQGRVRALASPRLLTIENEEAEVLVGERLGFRVTTTINQVTTESVEFIDSGVILRFTPSVDREGRILLEIHPEVSTGTITDGIPSVTTTEVTTQLLAENGERIFIGGLIRDSATESRRGVPLLSRIPFLGLLFSRSEWINRSTETVVIVTPTLRDPGRDAAALPGTADRIDDFEPALDERRRQMQDDLDFPPWNPAAPDAL